MVLQGLTIRSPIPCEGCLAANKICLIYTTSNPVESGRIMTITSRRCYGCLVDHVPKGCSHSQNHRPFKIQYDYTNHRYKTIPYAVDAATRTWHDSPKLECQCGFIWTSPSTLSATPATHTTDVVKTATHALPRSLKRSRTPPVSHTPSTTNQPEPENTLMTIEEVLDLELDSQSPEEECMMPASKRMSDVEVLANANDWFREAIRRAKAIRSFKKGTLGVLDVQLFDMEKVTVWAYRWASLKGEGFYCYDNQYSLSRPCPLDKDWKQVSCDVEGWRRGRYGPMSKTSYENGHYSWMPLDSHHVPERSIVNRIDADDKAIGESLSNPFGGLSPGVLGGYYCCLRAIKTDIDRSRSIAYSVNNANPSLTLFMPHALRFPRRPTGIWDINDKDCETAVKNGQEAFLAQMVLPLNHPAATVLDPESLKLSQIGSIVWYIAFPRHAMALTLHITPNHVYAYIYESSCREDYRGVLTKVSWIVRILADLTACL